MALDVPNNGWDRSASAWIDEIGPEGDWSRRAVLDQPMLERTIDRGFTTALDLGCGEGRFCRLMQQQGIRTIGIDPTKGLIERARALDPSGNYQVQGAEALDLPNDAVDLVVSYLSLIDIPDLQAAISQARRVLRPGGTFLIANLQSFYSACPDSWARDEDGEWHLRVKDYLDERAQWVSWGEIEIRNWHRTLSTYMTALLQQKFTLQHFLEPEPSGEMTEIVRRYRQAPYFLIMEWQKPVTA